MLARRTFVILIFAAFFAVYSRVEGKEANVNFRKHFFSTESSLKRTDRTREKEKGAGSQVEAYHLPYIVNANAPHHDVASYGQGQQEFAVYSHSKLQTESHNPFRPFNAQKSISSTKSSKGDFSSPDETSRLKRQRSPIEYRSSYVKPSTKIATNLPAETSSSTLASETSVAEVTRTFKGRKDKNEGRRLPPGTISQVHSSNSAEGLTQILTLKCHYFAAYGEQ